MAQRRFRAWVLDDALPPTFAGRDARPWRTGRKRFDVDAATDLRLSAGCAAPYVPKAHGITRWPTPASPWLPAATRRASRLPPLSPDCGVPGLR